MKSEKMTAEEVIRNFEKMGVVFTNEPNPIGKIQNFSMIIPNDERIVLKEKGGKK